MMNELSIKPWLLVRYSRLLADLQLRINQQIASDLPSLKEYLATTIPNIEELPKELKEYSLSTLAILPESDHLCHFDFHPDQVILSPEGPVVIDWMTSFKAEPAADVARTSILATLGRVDHLNRMTRIMVEIGKRSLYRVYLRRYLKENKEVRIDRVKKWMIPIAAARLTENVPGEKDIICQFIEKNKRSA